MRLGCSTSAFSTPLDVALASVSRLGFANVDLIAIHGFGHLEPSVLADSPESEAARVRALLEEHKLTPIAMNVAVGHLHDRTADTVQQCLREVEGIARFMKILGIPVASFYPGYRAQDRAWDAVLADTAATIMEMLAVATGHGVDLAVELHMFTPFETVEQGMRLLDAVPGLAVAYDPSHYAMQGIDLRETQCFLDRAVHVHLRDAAPNKMQVPVGEGTVDFRWILDRLKAREYTGNISIEYLADLPTVEHEVVRMREIVSAILAR